ncbi:hypothetical protein LJ707_10195 [Mucilaginibacter sp. UR6-1]|uniref:hypothetical protein n=1 Tax=Mucilaginibacter sp. UR6-1 TaxID=1435643 RepID=UPI001E2B0F11|nr:hypothetical protein [Mucilaginibacter sp. UR6-1]MCC8409304.1 hypothetical protein [Mucilaginibacter sp. UR6-1]
MESTINKERPEVRLRAFRAIDDPETCEAFIEGHTHVLTSIGVTKVTSSRHEWTENPDAFVMVVESLDGTRVYGGARVHVAGGHQPLPIEQATGSMDPKIFETVYHYAQQGTGELCGLWNSREIAGYGVGSIFLIRVSAAIAYQLGLQSLFALCAPYTVKPVKGIGMELVATIGNNGTFYYPKLDLVATTMLLKDVPVMSLADEEDKKAVFQIRGSFDAVREEELRGKRIIIHYETQIPTLANWSLEQAIANTHKNFLQGKVDEKDLNFL